MSTSVLTPTEPSPQSHRHLYFKHECQIFISSSSISESYETFYLFYYFISVSKRWFGETILRIMGNEDSNHRMKLEETWKIKKLSNFICYCVLG